MDKKEQNTKEVFFNDALHFEKVDLSYSLMYFYYV